jgi:hypothetical protein
MKNLILKSSLAVAITMLSFSIANAAAPVQFSFFDFNAPKASEVTGVRFPAIYGKGGGDIKGIDFQLLAYSEMNSLTGVSFPLLVVGANRISGEMNGVSLGLFNWHEGQDTGVNWGAVNITNNVKGLNLGLLNIADGHTVADVGMVNISESSNFQLSWVNVTQQLNGLQLGLVNCAKNGFLPCFIFFNFGQ